ncbi:MAG: hypothetical protein II047_13050 [Bacteroidales bacterium]|nr:hypothetical protein [Bacteroidales bacterium]
MRKQHIVMFGKRRDNTFLPQEGIRIYLNPIERTLYRLFVAHPEGITSDNLLAHWKELCSIYENESCFDDKTLRDCALESLCAESKTVFYSTVSRIKKKFVSALGRGKASPYIIQRGKNGLYKTRATLFSI